MQDDTAAPARPILVTILAVMTFIGTGCYLGYAALERFVPDLELQAVDMPLWITLTILVTQLVKTVAAVLLLRMRRIGFFLYTGMEVIGAIASIISGRLTMDYMETGYINPNIAFDPSLVVLLAMGMSIGLSILYVTGFAVHLGKMK